MTNPNTAPPPLTAAALDEIERLSKAATPGPYRSQRNKHPNLDGSPWGGLDKTRITWSGYQAEKDADYAVAACNAAPSLAAEVRAARERHDECVRAFPRWVQGPGVVGGILHLVEAHAKEEAENAALRAKLDALVDAGEAFALWFIDSLPNIAARRGVKDIDAFKAFNAALAAARQEPARGSAAEGGDHE